MKFLISGISSKPISVSKYPNPKPSYFTEKHWESILHLSNITGSSKMAEQIITNTDGYIQFIENLTSSDPSVEPEYVKSLTNFSKLVVTRVLRPDLFVEGIR
jgi:hypothetical protein